MAAAATKRGLVLVISILAAPWASDAQPTKVARVGFLSAGVSSDPAAQHDRDAFRQGLRDLGYVEGQNVVLEYRSAEGELDRLSALAAELVRLKVDVIVAEPSPPAVAAKKATGTIPIVMYGVGDPVGLGLIASLARPGGNVTGLSFGVGMDNVGKGLELLREAVPKARRIAILSNPAAPYRALAISNLKATARLLEVQLRLLEARGPSDFDAALAAMGQDRMTALFVLPDAFFYPHRARLADLAVKYRLPSMHGSREYVEAGGLMSYGSSVPDLLRRAATFADKILKGAKAADLPVEPPTKFELIINRKTAKALGLTVPPSLLLRADQVLE